MAKPSDKKPPTTTETGGVDRAAKSDGPKGRRRLTTHRFRWNIRLLLGIPIAIAAVALLLMRSPLVGSIVTGQIKSLTGCTLEGIGATGAYIDLDGRLVIKQFRLRVPDVAGDAGVVLAAEQAVVDLDWSGVLTLDIQPTAIRLSKPVFRVSQCIEDGEVNIGALAARGASAANPGGPGGGGGSGGVASAPRIDAIDGTIIMSEHAHATGAAKTLRQMHVSGSFTPVESNRPVYTVRFTESGVGREQAMLLDGKINLATSETRLTLYNLAFGAWTPETVPSAYRELWRRMNVRGRISSATLEYDKHAGARLDVKLENVAMNALIPSEESAATPTEAMADMGLRDVSGTVRFSNDGVVAKLTGKLASQRGESSVTLTTIGLDTNAALSCEFVAKRIGLTKETELLPYMPAQAKQYFRLFSGPTGEIDGRVIVSRGAPVKGEAAPIQVSGGKVSLRHGSAAFSGFPYPFTELSGTFEFDDRSLTIVSVEGHGPTGATLKASGLIAPLTDEAMVDVGVHAEHVPVDNFLLDAMPADRRRVLETVFSRPEYVRLLADNLVRVPGLAPTAENAALEFALAGDATIDIHTHTAEGRNTKWFTTIDVQFAKAGMLAEPFPLPIVARDVMLHITDDEAKLVSGTFEPLAGGSMRMEAGVTFFNKGKPEVRPDVRITATDVPIERLLLHALPQDAPTAKGNGSAQELSFGELMRRLNASGTAGCEAHVTAEATPVGAALTENGIEPRIAYDVAVDLSHAKAAPTLAGEPPVFSLEDFHGALNVTRSALSIRDLQCHLYRVPSETQTEPFVGPIQAANLTLSLERQLEGPVGAEGAMDGTITVSEANLSVPIERFVGVFAPEAGNRLAELRAQRQPSGRLHTTVRVHRIAGADGKLGTEFGVTLDNASNIEFAALGGRVGVDWPEGVIEVAMPASGSERLTFDHLRARLSLDGAPCGEARINGSVALDAASGTVAPPADLVAEFSDWKFESPLLPPLLERLTSESTAAAYRAFAAVGPFDAVVRVGTENDARRAGAVSVARVEAELMPKAMAFNWEGQRVVGEEVSGKVTLRTRAGEGVHPVSGRFDALQVKTVNWDASADGAWYAPAFAASPGAARPVQLALTFGLSGRQLDPSLRALMPNSAVDAIDALDAKFQGPFTLREATVRTTLGDAPSRTTFVGDLDFHDVSMAVGVPIDRCTGSVNIRVDARPSGSAEPTTFQVTAKAESLRIAGVQATSAETAVVSGPRPGEVLLPEISAQCYGGRLTGHISLQLGEEQALSPDQMGPPAPAPPAQYESELVLAGVRLAPVLADAAAAGATDPGPVGPPDPFTEPDPSRGVIDARLTLSGVAGDLSSRTGGGAIRVANGDIIKLPFVLPLMQLSNFQIPRKDRLGYMQAGFAIQGDTAMFDHISLLSDSIAVEGAGTLKWPDLTLDMKFNSRSNARIPVFSSLFEALRNEIVSTTVKGKLSSPIVREEPFTGTRRIIDRLLHPSAYADSPMVVRPSATPARVEKDRMEHAAEATAAPSQP